LSDVILSFITALTTPRKTINIAALERVAKNKKPPEIDKRNIIEPYMIIAQ
jgi:hypothetical protein